MLNEPVRLTFIAAGNGTDLPFSQNTFIKLLSGSTFPNTPMFGLNITCRKAKYSGII